MKIDLVAPHYHPVLGGIENHLEALAKHLLRRRHQVRVHVLAQDLEGRPLPATEEIDGVEVHRYPARARHGYYTTRFEPRLEGDVVHLHAHGTWTNDWVARHAPQPKVLTLHHGLHIPPASMVHRAYHWLHRHTRGRGTLARMQAILVNTGYDVDRLKALGGVDLGRVHVLPVPVGDEAWKKPAAKSGRRGDYFLYLGRLHEEKRPQLLIHALARLPTDVGIVLAGPDQGMKAELEATVKRLGLEGRVEFLGRVDGEEKRRLLHGAIATVLASRHEGLGLVLIESWAQGRPVIAPRVGAIPYLVEEGRNGLTYPSGDVAALAASMKRLIEDPRLADALGAAGLEKSHRFQEAPLLDRVLAIYQGLASRPRTITLK